MTHPAFQQLRQTIIPRLNLCVEEYRHIATGARHYHLAAQDNNNVFLVAFLTVPQDSTGVAHILEHTSLCGSQHFPVRDPFFMMTRRSLNTFMNAFTSSDWTAYPFASQNRKDFDNLLQVYLDATFFPNLHELDFAQEGHRLAFAETDNPNSDLVYKGVVFNEMKGAMSSPIQKLWQDVQSQVFPTTTYHYNSGGDPLTIPRLTHEQLKAFHAMHYHPSNAVLMTYGNRPVDELQAQFEQGALHKFNKLDIDLHVPDERRYNTPQYATSRYPLGHQEETRAKTHITLTWLLGKMTDVRALLNLRLLSGVLLDNSASPLLYALESSDLGTAPSPLCGYDDNTREMTFSCGLEGSEPAHADAVEQLVLQVLQDIADKGVEPSHVEAVLHQMELSLREISGDGFPYGLSLLVGGLSTALHGGDPIALWDIDATLEALRQDCQDPTFVPQLVKRLLLDNPHRVRMVMAPDTHYAEEQAQQERAQLAELQQQLSTEDKAAIVQQNANLAQHQATLDDPDLLPKVTLADVPNELMIPEGEARAVGNLPTTWYARGTNGMVYQNLILDLPALNADETDLLPLLCDCLTEVGCAGQTYLHTAARQAAEVGGINARLSVRSEVTDTQRINGYFVLSGKALVRNQARLTQLMRDTLETPRFDELSRLRELIAQIRAHQDNVITQRGHRLVMNASASGFSPIAQLNQRWHGFTSIQLLRRLDDSLRDEAALADFAARLSALQAKLLTTPRQMLVVSEAEEQAALTESIATCWQDYTSSAATARFNLDWQARPVQEAWSTNTQVNFCAQSYSAVPIGHDDAPALMVLGEFLRNGFLHTKIREQGGAYGGGANYDGDLGAFRFYSYRDPRLRDTLQDYNAALTWLQEHSHTLQSVEEAVLGVVSSIDRPGSPAGEAKSAFFAALHGRTPEWRRAIRAKVLRITLDDLLRVAKQYLQPEQVHTAVLSNVTTLETVTDLGLERKSLAA